MDISGVMTPAATQASQVSKQEPKESVGTAIQGNKAADVDKEAANEVVNSVVHQTQEIPTEKLPPHMGRNLDVTA